MSYDVSTLIPAIICICYYSVVLLIAEIARKIVDLTVRKGTLLHAFFVELIATAQMCTCVYENGIIIKHYGVWGFFTVVFSLLLIGGIINRGAFVSPLVPIEMFVRGTISTEKFLTILLAETIGGFSAFRFASGLWYYSLSYSSDHVLVYERLPCALIYKVSFLYVFLFEIFGCFIIRIIIHRLPNAYRNYIVPVVIASLLSFALAFIGVPGLNPVVASSRLHGCPGLDLQWFIMTYWCCPVVGWLSGAQLDHKRALRSSNKSDKKKN